MTEIWRIVTDCAAPGSQPMVFETHADDCPDEAAIEYATRRASVADATATAKIFNESGDLLASATVGADGAVIKPATSTKY